MTDELVKVDRRTCARELIESAIAVFFDQKSLIAANVLAHAAANMVGDLAKKNELLTFDALMADRIKPEYFGQVRNMWRSSYDFARHADRKPDAVDDFKPATVPFVIFFAMAAYSELFRQRTLVMNFFLAWFMSCHPEFLKNPELAVSGQRQFGDLSDLRPEVARGAGAREWREFTKISDAVQKRMPKADALEPPSSLIGGSC